MKSPYKTGLSACLVLLGVLSAGAAHAGDEDCLQAWSKTNYQGTRWVWGCGEPQPSFKKWNDNIASFKVPRGKRVTVWKEVKNGEGRGTTTKFRGDVADVDKGMGFRNRISAWTLESYSTTSPCQSLSPFNREQVEKTAWKTIKYERYIDGDKSKPKFGYKDETHAGHLVGHTQAALRLPSRNGNDYFMFTASQDKGGWLWVVEVAGGTLKSSTGQLKWFMRLKNTGCATGTDCNKSSNEGNFNHPARMTLVPGQDIVVIAFQDWKLDSWGAKLDRADPHGSDALAFYDVRNPSSPKFMFKMADTVSAHWGGNPPNVSSINNVTIGEDATHYSILVGSSDYQWRVLKTALTTNTKAPPAMIRVKGAFTGKAAIVNTPSKKIAYARLKAGAQMALTTQQVTSSGPVLRLTGDVCTTAIGFSSEWVKEGCDKASGFSAASDGSQTITCHHRKDKGKFAVLTVK